MWHVLVNSLSERLRKEDLQFKTDLGYTVRTLSPPPKTKQKQTITKQTERKQQQNRAGEVAEEVKTPPSLGT